MKSTNALTVRKVRSHASKPAEPDPSPAPAQHDVRGPLDAPRRLSMYDAICRSAMTRDAHEIATATVDLLALIERFDGNHADGGLERELRCAGALGKRERLPADLADQADNWLEDAKGLVWTLTTFRSVFGTSLYPLDRATFNRTGTHAFQRDAGVAARQPLTPATQGYFAEELRTEMKFTAAGVTVKVLDREDDTHYCDLIFTRAELREMLARCNDAAAGLAGDEAEAAPAVVKPR